MNQAQVITEEEKVHEQLYEQAKEQTLATLPEFLRHLAQDYQHDYGTQVRFWSKVSEQGTCWIWRGSRNNHGYGKFYFRGKSWYAHRVAYILVRGEEPEQLNHTCDTPACVRPEHLVPGDQRENLRQASVRGRTRGPAILTSERVKSIRLLLRSLNVRQVDVATQFGVSLMTINDIVHGRTWRWVR